MYGISIIVHNESPKYDIAYRAFMTQCGFSKLVFHKYAMQEVARKADS